MLAAFIALAGVILGSLAVPTIQVPSSFSWSSTGLLVAPKADDRHLTSLKDPSIVLVNGHYHVFASTVVEDNYSLVYFNFTDFNQANSSTFYYLDQSPIGPGYRAAPQVFYMSPQKKWYLVFQNGNAGYSTNTDIGNPSGWSEPKNFYSDVPKIIADSIANGQGYWVDMWVICDPVNCHLFSSDDTGRLYRSQTSVSNFPNGMSPPVIAMQADKYDLFEASNVYKVKGGYLLIVECIGAAGRRYFRSWTSTNLSGPWTTLAATESHPFAGTANVQFDGTPWTQDISHGELVRTHLDQTMSITPCGMQYLY